MDNLNILIVAFVAATVVNLLILCFCFVLFLGVKRALSFSKKVVDVEGTSKGEIEAHLERIAKEHLSDMVADLRLVLSNIQGEYMKSIEEATRDQINVLGDFVRDQEAQISKQASLVVEKVYQDAKAEIAGYKQAQYARIDEEVPKIIEKVSKEVLRKSIDISEHEELVMKALEKAKLEGVFREEPTFSAQVKTASKSVAVRRVGRPKGALGA